MPESLPTERSPIHVAATVHGRVFVRPATTTPAPLLVGFHGYGENGAVFLDSILQIPDLSHWHVATIEALHPFYARRTNAVVASWMTRQDRDLAIQDNVEYVRRAIDSLYDELDVASPKVFLGFSQGTAMAYRAAALSGRQVDAVVALAGDSPEEVDREDAAVIPRVLIGRGNDETWYTKEKLVTDLERLGRAGSKVETVQFDGGHEWTGTFRDRVSAFLRTLD